MMQCWHWISFVFLVFGALGLFTDMGQIWPKGHWAEKTNVILRCKGLRSDCYVSTRFLASQQCGNMATTKTRTETGPKTMWWLRIPCAQIPFELSRTRAEHVLGAKRFLRQVSAESTCGNWISLCFAVFKHCAT